MRKIIKIDEDKCDGCGLCVKACHEGAIVLDNGKARLAGEIYCDGLGDCIGECPQGAISFEMRDAAAYDESAVKARSAEKRAEAHGAGLPCGCPGTMAKELRKTENNAPLEKCQAPNESELANWPVQLKLVPAEAPYLKGAKLLVSADCTAFACPNFHRDLLPGKICLVCCPKLDEVAPYIEKLVRIIKLNEIKEIDVVYMEVPCCGGLVRIVEESIAQSGLQVTLKLIKLALNGKFLEIKQTFPQ